MISSFYKDRTLLVTGGTGFVGQALIAKILRAIPEVRKIYILIRPGKTANGQVTTASGRLTNEFSTSTVFDAFKRADPEGFAAAIQKVEAVEGDILSDGLGLDEADRARLQDEVDLVINSAATVVFDEPLDLSLKLNTLGPLALLELARSCRKGAIFLHVSTAYVNGQRPGKIVEEPLATNRTMRQIMEPDTASAGFDPEREISDCQAYCDKIYVQAAGAAQQEKFKGAISAQGRSRKLSAERLEQLLKDRSKSWIEGELVREGMQRAKALGWNDVYTFTKAIGEQILVKKQGEVPLVIVRPSIIESSLADPEPGWITGLKVTDPLIAAYGRGLMPDFPAVPDMVIDLVPVDMVVNTIIIAALRAKPSKVEVFQIATSSDNPIQLATLFNNVRAYFLRNPMLDRAGKAPQLKEWTYPSLKRFRMLVQLKYMLPLRLQEWVLERLPERWAPPQKKRLLSSLKLRLKRVMYYTDIYHPYTHLNCSYSTQRTRTLFNELSAAEKESFNLDAGRIDWEEYIQRIHIPGLRRFVLKDKPSEALFPEAPAELGQEEARWRVERDIASIPDLVRWSCARYPEKIAFQQQQRDGWKRYTYQEVQLRVDGLAAYWQEMGLSSGQRLLLVGDSSPQWVFSYFAASSLGLVIVPLDPQTVETELWALADFSEAQGMVASQSVYSKLSETGIQGQREKGFLFLNQDNFGLPYGGEKVSELPVRQSEWRAPTVGGDQVASIIYTAGTVIEPRGVMLTHRNFISNLLSLAEVQRVYESDQLLSLLPLHHALEFCGGLLISLLSGATTSYLQSVNSREILAAIQATDTTAMLAVPRILQALIDRIERLGRVGNDQAAAALKTLRLVVCGGAPLPGNLAAAYQKLGITLCQGYGLTEAGPVICVNPPARTAGVGPPLPGQEIAIDRPDAQGRGEVMTRGANTMKGYFKNPRLTAEILHGGWLKTGDLGYLDEDGALHITGRRKNLIVTGTGKNVYPEEVEVLFGDLPHVAELGVLGMATENACGEEVHGVAVVELPGGMVEAEVEQEIRQRLDQISRSLPSSQRLQRLHIRRRLLPRLADGSVDRVSLAAELALKENESPQASESEGLPVWESAVYAHIGQMLGLAPTEVAALTYEAMGGVMDSLMWIEFNAWLAQYFGLSLEKADRRRTLKSLVDQIASGQHRAPHKFNEASNFWAATLAGHESQAGGQASASNTEQPGRLGGALLRPYFSTQALGVHNLPQDRPYLIAANHNTHLDAPCIGAAIRSHVEHIILAAAQPYFLAPPKRVWLYQRLMEMVPCGRDDDLKAALAQLAACVQVRRPLVVFPEGNRSLNGQLKPLKTGAALLAYELDLPIVPAYITYRGQSGAAAIGKPHRVHLGTPLEIAPFRQQSKGLSPYETYREITDTLRRALEGLRRLA
jgi:long-chain acyl-CoA synthetase